MYDTIRVSEARFDAAATWAALTSEQQASIGAAALNIAVATLILDHGPRNAARAADAMLPLAEAALHDAVGAGLPEAAWWPGADKGATAMRLPAEAGDVCLVCGCSERDACVDGCAWHSHCLCTACSGPAVHPTSPGHAVIQARLIETSHRIRDSKGLPRLRGEEILGKAAPDLAPEDVKAICKGACRAVALSPLADVPPPAGGGLAAIATAIDAMHEQEASRG